MWGKVNKLGGGITEFDTPVSATFPFTATESGMANILINPSTSASSYAYISAYNANNTELYEVAVNSTAGMKNAIAIPLIKGATYKKTSAASNAVLTIKLLYFK